MIAPNHKPASLEDVVLDFIAVELKEGRGLGSKDTPTCQWEDMDLSSESMRGQTSY